MTTKIEGFKNRKYVKDFECSSCGATFTANEEHIHLLTQYSFLDTSTSIIAFCTSCEISNNLVLPDVVKNRVFVNIKNHMFRIPGCKHGLSINRIKFTVSSYFDNCIFGIPQFTTEHYSISCPECNVKRKFGWFELSDKEKEEIRLAKNFTYCFKKV